MHGWAMHEPGPVWGVQACSPTGTDSGSNCHRPASRAPTGRVITCNEAQRGLAMLLADIPIPVMATCLMQLEFASG